MASAPPAYSIAGLPNGLPPAYDHDVVRYVAVSANQDVVYLLRSDGVVDRSSSGKITHRTAPEMGYGYKYIGVFGGLNVSYLLRDDGKIDRTKGSGKITNTIDPPVGLKYVGMSVVENGYYLRDDGAIDRSNDSYGKVTSTINPPPGVRYVAVSAGYEVSYFLRDDGKIDASTSRGEIDRTIEAEGGKKYVAISDQLACYRSTGNSTYIDGNVANYFIREDGIADRTTNKGKEVKQIEHDDGLTKYISASAGCSQSYLVRDDGKVVRTVGKGKIDCEITPPGPLGAAKYVQASCGDSASYFLRTDGKVDRTTGGGKIKQTLECDPDITPSGSGCVCVIC